jgi:hypothetical protein
MAMLAVVVFLLHRLFLEHENYRPWIKDADFGKLVTKRNRI